MKYCAQLIVLSLFVSVAFSSEDEKTEAKKTVGKRGAQGLGNSLGHGFGGSGLSSGFNAPGGFPAPLNPASFSGFTPALSAPASWPSVRNPGYPADPGYGPGIGGNPGHGASAWNFAPSGGHGAPYNPYPDAPFGLAPAVFNKRTSLAAGLAHPDIATATAAAHERYAAGASNSAYSGSGPWSGSGSAPWSGSSSGPWSSAAGWAPSGPWSGAGGPNPNSFSKYGGPCRC